MSLKQVCLMKGYVRSRSTHYNMVMISLSGPYRINELNHLKNMPYPLCFKYFISQNNNAYSYLKKTHIIYYYRIVSEWFHGFFLFTCSIQVVNFDIFCGISLCHSEKISLTYLTSGILIFFYLDKWLNTKQHIGFCHPWGRQTQTFCMNVYFLLQPILTRVVKLRYMAF